MDSKYNCPCCNNASFSFFGEYDICPICGWEDDPIQFQDPDYSGGANSMSLNEAKNAFKPSGKVKWFYVLLNQLF
ncbi:hypothetical protein FE394_02535 [Xenorhabdus sp. Reich]|uniref:Cysteine-rich CPCC domain-containing protein n=2 Tax=Xenorhabdus littoralis TaxID=2582835 RepID=A0ABU4SHM7_9GAMM|nr:CPCC family cysteine-rich protein [Xenorhabdus sp. Reich]MDX7998101.1 hypothetical protein [Xenorhabdus sp. Reich]